jgi:hypothetical protein
MIRSFALLSELPKATALPKVTGVCKNTPQSFYDTPELGEVKRFLELKLVFLLDLLSVSVEGSGTTLAGSSFGGQIAWKRRGAFFVIGYVIRV